MGSENQTWKDLSTYNQDPSTPAIALEHLTCVSITQLFLTSLYMHMLKGLDLFCFIKKESSK